MRAFQQIVIGIIVAVTALFMQSTFFKFFLPNHLVPNLCLIFVLFLAFYEVSVPGALLAFLVGLLFDLSSGLLLGPWSASFTASFCILSLLSRRIFLDSLLAAILIAFVSSIFATAVYLGLLYQFQPSTFDVKGIFIESAATALVAPLGLHCLRILLVKKTSFFAQRSLSGA